MALAPLDRWTLGYLAVTSTALSWRWNAGLPHRELLALVHLLLGGLVFLAPRARAQGGFGGLLGEFYPLIVVTALYTELGLLNTAAGVSHDALVQAWEEALFGGQPSLDWIRAQPWPALAWPLHVGYLSYYFILVVAPLGLWITGRRDAARRTLLLEMASLYICYSIFLVFPVAGPRYLFPLARNAATETAIAVFTQKLLNTGSAWGTAFPSSHVAVALVCAVSAWWEWRALGAVLLPLAVLLTLGTVYGQFHYAVDALAGAVVAGAILAVARAKMTA
jgi:membrane-associated phospholipid phosphatase